LTFIIIILLFYAFFFKGKADAAFRRKIHGFDVDFGSPPQQPCMMKNKAKTGHRVTAKNSTIIAQIP